MSRFIMTPSEAAGLSPVRVGDSRMLGSSHGRGEIRLPRTPYPRELLSDFRLNPKVEALFLNAVGRALTMSLNHPDTAPRVLTNNILQERVKMCYAYAVILRRDKKWSLFKVCDNLPQALLGGIMNGRRPEDFAEASVGDGKAWAKDGTGNPELAEVVRREMAKDRDISPGDTLDEQMQETVKDIEKMEE